MDAIFMAKKKRYECILPIVMPATIFSFLAGLFVSSLYACYATNAILNCSLLFLFLFIFSGERDDEDEDADDGAEETSSGVLPTVSNNKKRSI